MFLLIQHVVTRNKFTLFRTWKLGTFTLQSKKLYANLLRTRDSSVVSKNYYYIVILFLYYVFSFASKGFVFYLLRWSIPGFSIRTYFLKIKFPKHFQSIRRMDKCNLFLSTNVLLFYVLTTLIHHFVLFFSILS